MRRRGRAAQAHLGLGGACLGLRQQQHRARCKRASNQKVLPLPGVLSAPAAPMSCARRLAIASPRPVPPCLRVVEASACSKSSNSRRCHPAGCRDRCPRPRNAQAAHLPSSPDSCSRLARMAMRPCSVKPDGVASVVKQGLAQARRVTAQPKRTESRSSSTRKPLSRRLADDQADAVEDRRGGKSVCSRCKSGWPRSWRGRGCR